MSERVCPHCGAPLEGVSIYDDTICDYCGSEVKEEEIIKKEKKTQINKKADTSYITAGICYNTCNIFTKDSKDYKACAGG